MSDTKYDLVTVNEAADMLDVSRITVIRLYHDGRLQLAARGAGQTGSFLFDRADVEALVGRVRQRRKAA